MKSRVSSLQKQQSKQKQCVSLNRKERENKPSRKWLPKRRVKVERWRMRPVPVVRLLKALVDQLSEKENQQTTRQRTKRWKSKRTFSEAGSRVTTRRAGSLLDVVRNAPTATARSVGLVVSLTKTLGTLGLKEDKSQWKKEKKQSKVSRQEEEESANHFARGRREERGDVSKKQIKHPPKIK